MLKRIRSSIANATSGTFIRNVLVLVGGTAFAQGLTVLILPLLTRLYAPEDFSTLAVYASLLAVLGSVACLRYEIAISLPEGDQSGAALLILALISSAAWGGLTAVFVAVFGSEFFTLIDHSELIPFSWLLPLGVWLQGSYAALQYWAARKNEFGRITRTRFGQAISGAATQLSFGSMGIAPLGLVLGHFFHGCAGVMGLGWRVYKHDAYFIRSVDLKKLVAVSMEYSRFPKYSTFESLANAGALQLPVLLIAALAVGPEAGYLLLATRVMAAPMSLVGSSIGQVYLSRAPTEQRSGTLDTFTVAVIAGLVKTGVGPLIFVGFVAPAAFPIIFGDQWYRAGELIAWMTPWFVMQFLSSPVSMVLHITNRQNVALNLQIFGFIFRVGLVILAFYVVPGAAVEVYAASGFLFYFVYFFIVLKSAGVRVSVLFPRILKDAGFVILWAIVGATVNVMFYTV